jgi:hypothetical protein
VSLPTLAQFTSKASSSAFKQDVYSNFKAKTIHQLYVYVKKRGDLVLAKFFFKFNLIMDVFKTTGYRCRCVSKRSELGQGIFLNGQRALPRGK